MKYKIGFRLDWLEMIFVFLSILLMGFFINSNIDDNYIYIGLLFISACLILVKRRVKIPLKDKLK